MDYQKDGKKIECPAIGSEGQIGQLVVLDHTFGDPPDYEMNPIARYPLHSVFTIVGVVPGQDGHYELADAEGERVIVRARIAGAYSYYLYDLKEWILYRQDYWTEKLERKDRKITQLEGHLAMLKDILVRQGIRIVTAEQAKALGLE